MKFVNVKQGSPEWLALKKLHRGASEASMMMNASKYGSRRDLMHRIATGEIAEVNDFTQKVFDKGHEVEEAARPIVEGLIGEDLYPAVALDDNDWLMASFDGITMTNEVVWECKQWNKDKAAKVRANIVPDEDYWQLVHQFQVGGGEIEKILYTVTDGTKEGTVTMEVVPDPDDCQKLIAHWAEFERDTQKYDPSERESGQLQGEFKADLPALSVEVKGDLDLAGNLDTFRKTLEKALGRIKTKPETDQEAADTNEAVKWCKTVEDRIKQAESAVMDQTATVRDTLDTLAQLRESVKKTRLAGEKGVQGLKDQRKQALVDNAVADYDEWIKQFDKSLFERAGLALPPQEGLFHAAMKGKKTLKGCQEAVDKALADMKVDTATFMGRASRNLQAMFDAEAEAYFPDLGSVIDTDPEMFKALIDKRRRSAQTDAPDTQASRPTNQQIVEAMRDVFERDEATVIDWLMAFEDPRKEQAA